MRFSTSLLLIMQHIIKCSELFIFGLPKLAHTAHLGHPTHICAQIPKISHVRIVKLYLEQHLPATSMITFSCSLLLTFTLCMSALVKLSIFHPNPFL